MVMGGDAARARSPSPTSSHRVNDGYAVSPGAEHVVGHYERPVVNMNSAMEVMEDEKSPEIKARAPERIRYPGIKIIISLGRRVISNNGRTLIIVIIVNDHGIRIGRRIVYLFVRNPAFRRHRGNVLGDLRLHYLRSLNDPPDHFQVSLVFPGNGFIAIRVVDHSILIDILINDVICRSRRGSLLNI